MLPDDTLLWLAHEFVIWGIRLYAAELQRCIHLKDDPEIYSRGVSSYRITCRTQDNHDPFLNGLLSSLRVSGDAPLLKCCCCVIQHVDDWWALPHNSAWWGKWSGMFFDGTDTRSALNERTCAWDDVHVEDVCRWMDDYSIYYLYTCCVKLSIREIIIWSQLSVTVGSIELYYHCWHAWEAHYQTWMLSTNLRL